MNHSSLFLKPPHLIVVLCVLLLQAGCTAGESLSPQYKSLYEFEGGCSLTFEIDGRFSHLTIASSGNIFFESREKKIATEARKIKIEAKKMNSSSYFISLVDAKTKKRTPVGVIPPKNWAEFSAACPAAMKSIDT